MKNSVKLLTLATVIAFGNIACNTGQQATTAANSSTIDSLKLTLEILKMQQAMGNVNASQGQGTTSKIVYVSPNNAAASPINQPVANENLPARAYKGTQNDNDGGYTDYDRAPTTPVITTSERIEQPKKKKMNEVTKGVLIGAGVGAVTGAVIAKKKVKGAVIGGVLGGISGGVAGKVIKNKKENKSTDSAVDKLLASF